MDDTSHTEDTLKDEYTLLSEKCSDFSNMSFVKGMYHEMQQKIRDLEIIIDYNKQEYDILKKQLDLYKSMVNDLKDRFWEIVKDE